jgi:uncharacterized protein (DUF427 family)
MAELEKGLPDWVKQARAGWRWRGADRPPFAKAPGSGQESVWDYPRPPLLVKDARPVLVKAGDVTIADTRAAHRLLETSHPPSFYLPMGDVDRDRLVEVGGGSFCEWKGKAVYFDVIVPGGRLSRVAWSYPEPIDGDFAAIAGHVAFYAKELACFVGGARVTPQSGGFYGGWITPELCGPFKGDPGSSGW